MSLGGTTQVALGSSFATLDEDDDVRIETRIEELEAIIESGVSLIRVDVSGDMLLEQEEPRILTGSDDDEDLAEVQARIDRQQAYEQQYMDVLTAADADVVYVDTQYSEYLLTQAGPNKDMIPWAEFVEVHENRIRHYAEDQPPYYVIVTEPETYKTYSAVEEPEDDAARLHAWVTHTQNLIEIVEEVSPETQIGIIIDVTNDFERDYYEQMLATEGLDFVGVSVYQIVGIDAIEDLLNDYGPLPDGKTLWITETWFGYCLAPQRSMDLDALWLETVVAFAAQTNISAVIANDYGCFLQPGGTLLNPDIDAGERTDVWRDWRDLVAEWDRR